MYRSSTEQCSNKREWMPLVSALVQQHDDFLSSLPLDLDAYVFVGWGVVPWRAGPALALTRRRCSFLFDHPLLLRYPVIDAIGVRLD